MAIDTAYQTDCKLKTYFLAELLSALWLEIFPGWNLVADDVQTTCRRRADDVRTTCGRHESETSLEISAGGWHMSSGRHPHVVRTRTRRPHIVCTSSAPLVMVSVGLNYLLLWQEFVIWWNLWQECWIVSFQDHVNDLRDNLCWWFSLHVASGHCSHLICICTYHLHIIWAYVYYAHIICTSPSYVLS